MKTKNNLVKMHISKSITTLFLLLLMLFAAGRVSTCEAKRWKPVKLEREITHPQPMTGLVMWPAAARSRHATYGQSFQLEFSTGR